MQIERRLAALILAVLCCSLGTVHSWPITNPEMVDSLIFSNPEAATPSMRDIPQWHCLRYFKHDIHLMRRCRNYRLHMLRRPNDMM
ncbi:uncharacterized protein LOC129744883 [Uranotaenia lowii]|uniref:uncharacterized protein LOC129741450 n=1 Tax=Uranotaenia lowii TaxID=190385 RepID=UPI0024797186|nr:uncharacterized protein LOC129741450 [Uranotaenia lowii]XP_055589160.1 uncharacterized protein LOC129741450 [Uranotaenia lowii]XP_055589161.1 uncharacterized protein LOC129741450 [Uranotaenia lowii]XP_055589162.1 uncharacterized protein LOC129741450 [Uranotaenia lowii]XP_055593602.1 uncharacterized protein LOC129744883 [Uranotaenia lowii]XP_055593603.1 uncharacterized protein LOC129744883 [Uranotaenia lowii]XP_055593604.1 uncharacterized protein LOC129744883 [Uranotaenia lowii]XP_05559360